ncbi:replicative DNA helicase [Ectobacillus polymachus]|uniref:replicative DNA helicase n=1 Tax=Ectobacillus polymachus TaxID=1508806 RepID=UPI003A8BCC95
MIQNIEAEQAVLGSFLLDGELIKESRLTEKQFSTVVHCKLFQVMQSIVQAGEPLEATTLVQKLGPGFLEEIGGISYFVTLVDSVATVANIKYYEELVQSSWKMRVAAKLGYRLHEQLHMQKEEGLISTAVERLLQLEEEEYEEEDDIKDTISEVYRSLLHKEGELNGIDTGFAPLNNITGGLQVGDFIVIGARPSMGKTAFALNLAIHASKEAAVGIFSLEMSKQQLLKRMLTAMGMVRSTKLRNPKLKFTIEDWKSTTNVCAELSLLPLTIYDNGFVTPQQIEFQIRKLKKKYKDKPLLIIIDYLQLLTGDSKNQPNRFQEMSEVSRKLKQIARDQNVCIVALSQLSRGVDSRADKRPLLSDLRETGQIEQDADVIMLMYREEYYDKNTDKKDLTEINVAKHRNGPIGSMKLRFLKEYGRFEVC